MCAANEADRKQKSLVFRKGDQMELSAIIASFGSVESSRSWKVLQAPGGDVAEQFAQTQTGVAELVGVSPPIGGVRRSFDPALLAQRVQPRRENICGYSLGRAQEILEVPLASQQVTHDQERPTIANDVQGARDGTIGTTLRLRFLLMLHHPDFNLRFASIVL